MFNNIVCILALRAIGAGKLFTRIVTAQFVLLGRRKVWIHDTAIGAYSTTYFWEFVGYS